MFISLKICRLGGSLNPLPNDKFHTLPIERVCRDNFKFNGNGRKFLKWVENTAGKGENVCYKQFLLLPQCFQKICTADT